MHSPAGIWKAFTLILFFSLGLAACGSAADGALESAAEEPGFLDSPAQVDTAELSDRREQEGKRAPRLFYVSMGDSLATGVQQDPETGIPYESDQGYPDQIYAMLKQRYPGLVHVRLGCGGETTTTMLEGGLCDHYRTGSQMGDAVKFFRDHRDRIVLATLNMAANDIAASGCIAIPDPAAAQACFMAALQKLAQDQSVMADKLTRAARGKFPIIAANLFNTYISYWIQGDMGKAVAMATNQLLPIVNHQVLGEVYAAYGIAVADMQVPFDSYNWDIVETGLPAPLDLLPANVAAVCRWSYACPAPGSGLPWDAHLNTEGYRVMAETFVAAFDALP